MRIFHSRRALALAAAFPVAALCLLALGSEHASADCQLQWRAGGPDGNGHLVYVCNKPGAPTGSGGGSGGKRKPTYSAIAVSVASLNDGDLEFGGAYSAGYAKRKKAVRSASRACRRAYEGRCRKVASARNGWAVIVAVLDDQERIRVFGGSDTGRESAFQEAERRTRDAFGGTSPYPIQRVRAVRSKTAKRR